MELPPDKAPPAVRDGLRLQRLSAKNFFSALRLARAAFPDEVGLVATTYGVQIARRSGHNFDWLLGRLGVHEWEGEDALPVEVLRTVIHGRDAIWAKFVQSAHYNPTCAYQVVNSLFVRYPGCNKVVLALSDNIDRFLPSLYAGFFPTRSGRLHLHLCRRGDFGTSSNHKLKRARKLSLDLQLDSYVVERRGKAIGLTGTYSHRFWPGLGWGSWGSLDRKHAQRERARDMLWITENLLRSEGYHSFLIETTDSEAYKSARWLYERNGMEVIARLSHFYHDTGQPEDLLIYGKSL